MAKNGITISIHALLAESDCCLWNGEKWHNNFYPRSPCGERHLPKDAIVFDHQFLSTLSLRRATVNVGHLSALPAGHFYPRSPCGERLMDVAIWAAWRKFLSTLSLRRATLSCRRSGSANLYFYPRSPCGERLQLVRYLVKPFCISIHALLAESDFRCGCCGPP